MVSSDGGRSVRKPSAGGCDILFLFLCYLFVGHPRVCSDSHVTHHKRDYISI